MSAGWIVLGVIVILLVWAGWTLRQRGPSTGPEARGDRHRRTGGYGDGG